MVKVSDLDKVIVFQSPEEKAKKLFDWDLVSEAYVRDKKYLKEDKVKNFKYFYNRSNLANACEVVGYIMYPNNNGETAVVNVNNELLKIMPAYLKEMQLSTFISQVTENSENTDLDVNNSKQQIEKQIKSQSLKPSAIDFDLEEATYIGSTGKTYTTTLHKCSCKSFKINKLPCKHMYNLSQELNKSISDISITPETNDADISENNITYSNSNEFVCIDFETANAKRQSVCQVALIYFKDGEIVDEKSWLVKPPREYNYFKPLNIQIHNIRPEDVQNSLEFNQLWEEIKPIIEGRIIVAHNAPFDISVLRSLIDHYSLECDEFNFICTCNVARKTWDNQVNYTLKTIANQLGYIFKHHDAHDDARVCGKILIDAMKVHECNNIYDLAKKINMQIGKVNKGYYQSCSISNGYQGQSDKNNEIKTSKLDYSQCIPNENNAFCNKGVCITGTLVSMTRANALQKIVDIGGIACTKIDNNTNYLVMGLQDYSSLADGKQSIKTKKAKELIAQGQDLQIISEDDFLRMLYEGDENECACSV